jgi:hypothetical protein
MSDAFNDITETLKAVLCEDTGIAGMIGSGADARIYPNQMPDGVTFPAIVLTKVIGMGDYDQQGDTGVEDCRVQVDLYSDQGKAALNVLRRSVRGLLSGFRGGPAEAPCAIQSCFVINDADASDPSTERGGPRLRRRMLEFRIFSTEV